MSFFSLKLSDINQYKIPTHLAIIMDGNARWAKRNKLLKIDGYRKGIQNSEQIILKCAELSMSFLTLFIFSSENWNRPDNDVSELMNLFEKYISDSQNIEKLYQQNIRIRFIGNHDNISQNILSQMQRIEEKFKFCSGLQLIIAFSYGGRDEIMHANYKMIKAFHDLKDSEKQEGFLKKLQKFEISIQDFMYMPEVPDPDLIIRTSGEQRLSNFLLWQAAYSELYFTKKLWPDFKVEDLVLAFQNFTQRERKFGK